MKKRILSVGKFLIRTKKGIAILIILFLVLLNFANSGGANSSAIKTEKVEPSNIKTEVIASGKVSALNDSTLHFAVAGQVVGVNVTKGDFVEKGQILAYLDASRYQASERQAEQDFTAAKAASEKFYDDPGHRDSTETFDEKIERTSLDAAQNKAYDSIVKARRDLQDTVLVAPISGVLAEFSLNTGEEVTPVSEIGKIIDDTGKEFSAEVDETEIGPVHPGLSATITLDAFPDRDFQVGVKSVGDESITTSAGATAYEVKFPMPQESDIRIGMNGEAHILLKQKKKVLVIPFDALQDDKYVYLKKGNTYQKVKVEKGIESDTEVEITKGLSEKDVIVTSGFEELGKKSLLQKIFSF